MPATPIVSQPMKCDLCDNEATVRETTIEQGVPVEKHLCEGCAAKEGLAAHPGAGAAFIKGVVIQAGPGVVIQTPGKAPCCPACSLTFSEFKAGGLLGCQNCYRTFEALLAPLVERAHEGGVKHAGKSPRRQTSGAGAPRIAGLSLEERAQRLRSIRKELESAVAAEQYELAARLRDELRRLSETNAPSPPASES